MNWLSFVNGVIGIALILIAVSGLVSHGAAVPVATGFARFSADHVRAQLPH
jgi:hypothetical protein